MNNASDAIQIILDKCKDIDTNVKDIPNSATALHYAAWLNHSTVIEKLLLFPNIEVNARDKHGGTPLMHAISEKHNLAAVQKLLASGATQKKIQSNHGISSLHACFIFEADTIIFETLVEDYKLKNGEVSSLLSVKDNKKGETAVLASCNKTDELSILIKHAGKEVVPFIDIECMTTLLVRGGNSNLIKELIELGIDLEMKDKEMDSNLLHIAATFGRTKEVEALLVAYLNKMKKTKIEGDYTPTEKDKKLMLG